MPLKNLEKEDIVRLKALDTVLKKRILGQDEGINAIVSSLKRSRMGISSTNRPIGSFLFLGPTGVGKTELVKVLAEEFFADPKALIKIDMSEFQDKSSASKLIGATAGYVGYEEAGQFTEAVRHRPYSVILFDEIEKAHPDVFNLLLQVLDDGHLTDGKGRKVNFKNTIIIMTSNLGSQHIQKMQSIGFSDNTTAQNYQETKDRVLESLKEFFRPEFLNRLDEIIVFDVLPKEIIRDIVHVQIYRVMKRMQSKNIALDIKPAVIEHLAEKGFDPQFGA